VYIATANYKLVNHSFHYDLRKHFSARIVNIWNSLPNSIVDAFKARLDEFRSYQAVKYDFTADLTGTGNRSSFKVKKFFIKLDIIIDAGMRGVNTYVRNVLLS